MLKPKISTTTPKLPAVLPEYSAADITLLVAVVIFNAISIYTTQQGFSLVLSDRSAAAGLVSWGFAGAIGLCLLAVTLYLALGQVNKKKRNACLFVYLFLVSVSILFNFNYCYNLMAAQSLENESYAQLKGLLQKTISRADKEIRSFYEVDELQEQLDEAEAGMSFEEDHPLEPGQGLRFTGHKQKMEEVKERLATQTAKYQASLQRLEVYRDTLQNTPTDFQDYESAHAASTILRESTNSLISLMDGEYEINLNLSSEEKELLGQREKKTGIAYSLQTIAMEIGRALDGDWQRTGFFWFVFAFVVAMMIDLPVFFAVFFLKGDMTDFSASPKADKPKLYENAEQIFDL